MSRVKNNCRLSFPAHGAWGYWSLEGPRDAASALVASHDWCHCCVVSLHVLHTAARLGTKQQRFWPCDPGHLYRVKFNFREWQFCVLLAQPRMTSLLENQRQSRGQGTGQESNRCCDCQQNTKERRTWTFSECLMQNLILVSQRLREAT